VTRRWETEQTSASGDELVLDLKTPKALGLIIPSGALAIADATFEEDAVCCGA
jgi:hypothetical protein